MKCIANLPGDAIMQKHATAIGTKIICWTGVAAIYFAAHLAAADSVDRQVKDILRIGVEGQQSPSSKLPALQTKFSEIGDGNTVDPKVRYAFGLVHGALGKSKEASNLLVKSTQELT